MFGMGFMEIVVILIVAVIVLGPEKLPSAIMNTMKIFKAFKNTINEAKTTIDKEINLSELQKEAISFKDDLTQNANKITQDIQINEISEMFNDFKDLPRNESSENLNSQNAQTKSLKSKESTTKTIKKNQKTTKKESNNV